MSRKRSPIPREIEASRIVLVDPSGRARIVLDAGGDEGYASIYICSPDGRHSMQVGTQPSGHVVMSFDSERMNGVLTLSTGGMVLHAQDGTTGIVIGPINGGPESVTVYRNGKPVWVSPTEHVKRKRQSAPKRRKSRGDAAGT